MMGSICAEQQHHKFHHSHQLFLTKKTLREIDIPPRKQLLLARRPGADSPKMDADNSVFSKFLPYNDPDNDSDDCDDPYSSDHFRMYEFKVRKCNRSRSHDWTDCPFAHPGEKARRRDPRRFRYSGTVCPDFRKGHCGKGDACDFSHGVFECWLHPSRYRTEACKDGKSCKRKICFFAHSSRQLRIVPDPGPPEPPLPNTSSPSAPAHPEKSHCCIYCHCTTASPTSTLIHTGISPPLSPPISPYAAAYKDALAELKASFDAMNVGEASPSAQAGRGIPWLDVNFNVEEQQQQQPQFVMSPSTPSPVSRGHSKFYSGENKFYSGDFSGGRNLMDDGRSFNGNGNEGGLGGPGPDLGWVNDLLT